MRSIVIMMAMVLAVVLFLALVGVAVTLAAPLPDLGGVL
jgi:hypothetical protein